MAFEIGKILNFSVDVVVVTRILCVPRKKRTGSKHGGGVLAGSGSSRFLVRLMTKSGFALYRKN